MADTFSLRFEIDASRAEAGAKKFVSAINAVNKSLDSMDAKAEKAFSKLMAGGASGGDFTKLAKDLGKVNNININPNAVKSLNSLGNAFKNLKAPSTAAIKNISTFASTIPALLNSFNVSSNFADSLNKVSGALAAFKVPSVNKIEALKTFGDGIKNVLPSLRVAGNFSGIVKLGEALGGFRAPSEKAVSNMKSFFNALNSSGSKATINSSLVNGIINLSSAVGNLKSPSSTSVKNLKDLFNTLASFKPVGGTNSISKITQAFSGFKGPTQAQTKNLRDFVTMLGSLKVPTNALQIGHYLEQIGISATRANASLHNFRNNLNGLGANGFNSSVAGMTTNLRGLENAFSGTFQAASVFRTLVGSITLGTLSKSIYDANTNFNAFKSTMLAVNDGSLKETGNEMRYVSDMANRLGQKVVDIQESYGGFAVSASLAGVSQDQTRKIFESTITAMTVLHRSSDRTKLALLALEQMMSKGNVSSEELRRQLGEQMPGSVNLMARALKVSTAELNDMLKAGAVLSADALPKFAAEVQKTYGPSLTMALHNATAQFNLMSNAVNDLFVVLGQSGTMDALAGAFERVKNAIAGPEFTAFARDFGERTGVVIEKLGRGFEFLIKNIDSVVTAFKILLALNIARFFQSFAGLMLGSVASMGAWKTSVQALAVAFTGLSPALNGAATAVGVFGRAAAFMTALSGPVGLVIGLLGTLGTAWYMSSQQGEEFTTVVDRSKESLDRYSDSLQLLTTSQLVLEQQRLKAELIEIEQRAAAARDTFNSLVNNAPSGRRWEEVQSLASELKNLKFTLDDTGMTFDQFVKKLANRDFKTEQAKQLRQAFLELQNAVATTGAESAYTQQKLDNLNKVMNSASADGFAGEMAKAASAASAMADAVASAAGRVVNAMMQMNMSKAQSLVADDLMDAAKSNREALDMIGKSEASIQDKRDAYIAQNNKYAEAQRKITKSGEELLKINTKLDTKKQIQSDIENMGNAATETGNKIFDLTKRVEALRNSNEGTVGQRQNAITILQKQIADAEKAEAKRNSGGGGKGKGGKGGGAASYLDEAGKATQKYNKDLDSLDKMLKKGQITQDQYNSALDRLKEKYAGLGVSNDAFTSAFEQLRNELMPTNTAMQEFTKNQDILKQAMDAGKISGEEYLELLTRLQKKYSEARTGNSWVDGINKGLTDLTKTSDDFVNDVAGAVSNAFNGLEDALTEWVTTGKMDFKSLTQSILSDVARIVIRYTVIQPIIKALSGLMGGLGLGGSGGGFPPAPTVGLYANGGAFNPGKVVPFAKGGLTNGSNSGIVSSPTLFDMAGGKTGLMGEAGYPEAIMPLTRGPDGKLGVQASGAVQASQNVYVQPKVNISIQNNGTNAEASASVSTKSDGTLDVKVLMEQVSAKVASDVSKGGTKMNKAFENRYGANAAAGNKR